MFCRHLIVWNVVDACLPDGAITVVYFVYIETRFRHLLWAERTNILVLLWTFQAKLWYWTQERLKANRNFLQTSSSQIYSFGACCLHYQGNADNGGSKILWDIIIHHTTQCNIPEGSYHHTLCCENLKFQLPCNSISNWYKRAYHTT